MELKKNGKIALLNCLITTKYADIDGQLEDPMSSKDNNYIRWIRTIEIKKKPLKRMRLRKAVLFTLKFGNV